MGTCVYGCRVSGNEISVFWVMGQVRHGRWKATWLLRPEVFEEENLNVKMSLIPSVSINSLLAAPGDSPWAFFALSHRDFHLFSGKKKKTPDTKSLWKVQPGPAAELAQKAPRGAGLLPKPGAALFHTSLVPVGGGERNQLN